nr:60S ribosomal protein L4-like [Ipomoea trifida]GMD25616.1 60S ribosomal protein L4-like [Ipomoea batatas]
MSRAYRSTERVGPIGRMSKSRTYQPIEGDEPIGRMNEGVGPKDRLKGMKEAVDIGTLWVYQVGESVQQRNKWIEVEKKKAYVLPWPKMVNVDLAKIINSGE